MSSPTRTAQGLGGLAIALAFGTAAVPAAADHPVPLFPSADDNVRQGFVRVINHAARPGEVSIEAIDDAGTSFGPITFMIGAGETTHFNSDDLEVGNARKGLASGTGPPGQGDWRLMLSSDLDIEVLSYIRTTDGFLTSMLDVVPAGEDGTHRVAILNPGSNLDQVSRLRLANLGDDVANVTITGVDGQGESPGNAVGVTIPASAARTFTAEELEAGGSDFTGALGDGVGKWRMVVETDAPLDVMSLMQTPTGHLTNLSTAPRHVDEQGTHGVALFPAASDSLGRQGFVAVVNHSGQAGEVSIQAVDNSDRVFDAVTLAIDAGETVHFNSDDLELGNANKGLPTGVGAGTGDWRLALSSDLDIQVRAYIRTKRDGFLTAMHDAVPVSALSHRVAIFNPGSNMNQVSELRLVNEGTSAANVTITAVDDAGQSPGGAVTMSVAAGTSRTLTAADLEAGNGVNGALGDGVGKWQLVVEADVLVTVMSLLSSPTDHLTNLSTVPTNFAPTGDGAFNDRFVGRRLQEDDTTGYFEFFAAGRFRQWNGEEYRYGTFGFANTGAAAGTLSLDYDDGARCDAETGFGSRRTGTLSVSCLEGGAEEESTWRLDDIPRDAEVVYEAVAAIDTLPGDAWTPDAAHRATFSTTGGTVTVTLESGGYVDEGGRRYTCDSVQGCEIVGREVTAGRILDTEAPAGGGMDLVVELVSVDDAKPMAGEALTLRATVRNRGDLPAAATTLRYFQSMDARISSRDTRIGSDAVDALAAGAAQELSYMFTAPSRAGYYYYGACVEVVVDGVSRQKCSVAVPVTVPINIGGVSEGFALNGDNRHPAGIAYANNRLYVLDDFDDRIYAYHATSSQREALAEFDLDTANRDPRAMAYADGSFYVVDGIEDKVYAYLESGERDADADIELDALNSSPWAIERVGGKVFVADVLDGMVYAYLATGERDAGADFLLDSSNDSPWGMAYVDQRFFVVDVVDDRVFAYDAEGQRDEAFDFALHADNRSPEGIAFGADDRFYVADYFDDAVYGYPFPDAPDLVVDPLVVSDPTPVAGATFTVTATLRNVGKATSGATSLSYYLSTELAYAKAEALVETTTANPLSPGGTDEVAVDMTAPNAAGCYVCGVCADTVEGERSSTNNCSEPTEIQIGQSPDLDFSRFLLSSPATVGQPVRLIVGVVNRGAGRSGPAKLKVSGGVEVVAAIPALDPDESVTLDTLDLGIAKSGSTTYEICISDVPCEGNLANNCRSRTITY